MSVYDIVELKRKYFERYLDYVRLIKDIVKKLLNDNSVKVIVFGSIVKGKAILYEDKCFGCGVCVTRCRFGALEIEW